MQNEKLKILKMLENGQISADEAARLLQSLDGAITPPTPPHTPPPRPHTGHGNNGRPPTDGASSSHSFDDFGRKIEDFARDMAPKVKKFAEVAVGAIAGVTEKVSDSLSGSHSPTPPHRPSSGGQHHAPSPSSPRPPKGKTIINVEELVEAGSHNELNLSVLNGPISIKGYNGDKITACISYEAKHPGASVKLEKLGGKYFLNYDSNDFNSVSIDAYVPDSAFNVVKLDSVNGSINCSSITANDIHIDSVNGAVSLTRLSAKNITSDTSNGALILSNIVAEYSKIEHINGATDIVEPDIANFKVSNCNGSTSVVMSDFKQYSDYNWDVETSNSKLTMYMPTMPNLGYHVKAHTSMSEIRLGLTGLQFLINEPNFVEAKSISFDTAAKRVKLAAETSNAPLHIS